MINSDQWHSGLGKQSVLAATEDCLRDQLRYRKNEDKILVTYDSIVSVYPESKHLFYPVAGNSWIVNEIQKAFQDKYETSHMPGIGFVFGVRQ